MPVKQFQNASSLVLLPSLDTMALVPFQMASISFSGSYPNGAIFFTNREKYDFVKIS